MSDLKFLHVVSSEKETEAFKQMRERHLKESSEFGDSFYLDQVFNYLHITYTNFTASCKETLKPQKEENITDYIRGKLRENEDFSLSGFIVNTEARNQAKLVGYYDLKFEHSDWVDQYFVLECKPISAAKKRMDAYVHTESKTKTDGGLYRFLINKYATNKQFGGMLGYIVDHKPKDVMSNLKDKIRSFQLPHNGLVFGTLEDPELLDKPIPNFKYSFQSNHTRLHEDKLISPIHIFHLFMDFTE